MIDYACIFTTGGVVLWCKAFCDTTFKLDIVNMFIKTVLLDDKTLNRNSYSFQDNVLRWKMQSDLKIVFAIVYKEILQLTMIDDFLERLQYDFMEKVWPRVEIKGDVIITPLPLQGYGKRFDDIMLIWEQNKQMQTKNQTSGGPKKMKTFQESNKSKKSKKKSEKKKIEKEEAGQGESAEDDLQSPEINSVEAARMNLKKKQSSAAKKKQKE